MTYSPRFGRHLPATCVLALLLIAPPASLDAQEFDNPVWSPDGRWIAFTDAEQNSLFLCDTTTGLATQVASSPSTGYAFRWSPDSTLLGFKLLTPTPGAEHPLQVPACYDVVSASVTRLHSPVARAGVPSFAGDRVAFTIGGDLRIVDRAGQLLQILPLGHPSNLAALSPDGSTVAFNDEQDQICVINLATGQRRRLTDDGHGYFGPLWSPDSTRLIVSTVAEGLKSIEVAGGQLYDLGPGRTPSWAPDSRTVFFTRLDRIEGVALREAEICHAQCDGTGLRSLTRSTSTQSTAARLSPTGDRIAFISPADGMLRHAPIAPRRSAGAQPLAADSEYALGAIQPVVVDTPGAPAETVIPNAMQPLDVQPLSTPVVLSRAVPYVHQVYDTPNAFNGHSACGATSAIMAIIYYDKLPRWDITVSSPYSHISPYGQYVSAIYTYNGYTYNIGSPDPNGNPGYGGYGYIVRNNWADTKGYMRDYFINHGISSSVDWSPSWAELQTEVNNQNPFVLLNSLTTAGHYITTIGYFPDMRTAVFNDPYGNKNTPGYPSYDGAGARYDWPGESNGYKNLNTVHCFIYARATVPTGAYIVESRTGGQNTARYSETGVWADHTAKSTAGGVTGGIGSRWGSSYRSVAGEKHAIFQADLAQGGTYEVFATWGAGANRRSPILHRITHLGGTADVNVDQSATANAWVSLGTYTFAAGTNVGRVDVSNLNVDVSGNMYADAVKWELRTPIAPPTVTQHPANRSACAGAAATMSVTAGGTGPLAYQWQKAGSDLPEGGHYTGTTTSTLTISNIDAGDAASYRCRVSNAGGSVNSNTATLTVKPPTTITQQPPAREAIVGTLVQFTVAAAGDGTLTWQWQKNGSDLTDGGRVSGATSATLTVSACTKADAGDYRCVVTGGCGAVTSDAGTLVVRPVVPADFDVDGAVNDMDLMALLGCMTGPGAAPAEGCGPKDLDEDNDVDQADFGLLQRCLNGPFAPDPLCM